MIEPILRSNPTGPICYTSCPLVVSYGKLVLTEFAYEGKTKRLFHSISRRAALNGLAESVCTTATLLAWQDTRTLIMVGITVQLWHDRAVFQFLTSPQDRQAYLNRLNDSLTIGGHFIVTAFALNGPEKCSGLQVCRYDVRGLESLLRDRFTLWNNCEYSPVTPMGNTQQFTWAVFQKT